MSYQATKHTLRNMKCIFLSEKNQSERQHIKLLQLGDILEKANLWIKRPVVARDSKGGRRDD